MSRVYCALLSIFCILVLTPVEGGYVIKDGWFADSDEVPTLSAQEHFNLGIKAIEEHNWVEAVKQFKVVSINFPSTPYGQDAHYYLGISYFFLEEFDFANDAFTQYLKVVNNPKFFQESVEYKYCSAEKFKNGAKRRFFGTKKMPKWASGQSVALKIYDEVITTVPSHEIAAKALVSKGCLLWSMYDYHEAVDALQMVIKRFPKHELAPECYLLITRIYLEQCKFEFQNPDILAFAQINLRKFKHDFPREERLADAEAEVMAIKEVYAKGLYDTGQFYERISHPRASIIYYQNAINQFPDTGVANLCRERLKALCVDFIPVEQVAQTPT